MASNGGPDFEPAFGSRATERPLEPRRRDRHLQGDDAPGEVDLDAIDTRRDGLDEGAEGGGSISELVDSVEAHRTIGDDTKPFSAPRQVARDLTRPRGGDREPVIPAEQLEAGTRSKESRDGVTARSAGKRTRVGNRWFRVRQRFMATCAVAIVLALVYFLVSLLQVWSTGRTHDDSPVDAIVVMGAAQYDGRPSPQLAARLDHVVELWPTGLAPLVVVTGGNIPGDRFTEAEASKDYLAERGVPADAILLENTGSTTQQSLTSVSAMLGDRGLNDVVIVTDPYHALRSRLIAEEVGLEANVSSTETSVVTGFDSLKRHVQEAGGVAVGRVIGFRRLSELVD